MRLSREARRRWAWLKSFLKLNWSLSNYPLDYVDQGDNSPNTPRRWRHERWRADLIGWPGMSGSGETRERAFENLKQKFAVRVATGEPMYRPGTGPAITFAATDKVDQNPELRDHFIQNVLGLDWAFVSDESSLWEFHEEETNDAYLLKIGEVYGVDVSYVENANVAEILKEIMDQIGDFPEDDSVRAVRLNRSARDRHIMCLPEHPWNPY